MSARGLAIIDARTAAKRTWITLREVGEAFIEDDALNRGAAIAFYAITAMVPILYIVIAIVGALFGHDAARGALTEDARRMVGPEIAHMLAGSLQKAAYTDQGFFANAFSVGFLIIVASGAFGEMRAALNVIWRSTPKTTTWMHLLRVRAESLGLVAALAFLMLTSMVITAVITAAGHSVLQRLPATPFVLQVVNFCVMWLITSVLFAAIYRILPDKDLTWRDVAFGGIVTALLFQLGQIGIGFYLGNSRTVSIYGAAGSLMALLLWIYYSAIIFLVGAELTKVFTEHRAR